MNKSFQSRATSAAQKTKARIGPLRPALRTSKRSSS